MAGQLSIPGQSSIPGRTSIPVRNRSGRTIAIAGMIAGLLAVNQWLHWMGITNGDLFSLIPGFAQAGMQANAYPDEKGFNCANQSLGAEAEMMSEEMLKTVGTALCANDHMQPASLRGTDNFYVNQQSMMRNRSKKAPALRLQTRERGIIAERPASSMLVASIEPGRLDTNQDLVDRIEARARRLDAITPRDRVDDPREIDDTRDDIRLDDDLDLIDDDNSGSGSDGDRDDDADDDNSGHDSGDDDDHSGSSDDDDDHSGSGGGDDDDHSGSGSDDHEDDGDHSGSGSDDHEDDHSGSGSGGDRDRDRYRDGEREGDDDRDSSGSGSGSRHS
jgi:hypothetical protein